MKKYKSVDEYISAEEKFQEILSVLRDIILETELNETVKWGIPVYTIGGKNVVGMGAFKEFVSVWFFQGATMTDRNKKLINAQEGRTRAGRQWRFSKLEEIDKNLLQEYIAEAIQNQKSGKVIKPRKKKPLIIPPELKNLFEEYPEVEAAFNEFNLTRKREFTEYIEMAKQESTKANRLQKIKPLILGKIGLNDKYR